MRCPRCQDPNPTGMKFCWECAAPLWSCPDRPRPLKAWRSSWNNRLPEMQQLHY
jgi:hypothetical protein